VDHECGGMEATRLVRSRLAARVSHIPGPVTGYFLTSLNAGKRHGKVEVWLMLDFNDTRMKLTESIPLPEVRALRVVDHLRWQPVARLGTP
jgi:hypothetical protein